MLGLRYGEKGLPPTPFPCYSPNPDWGTKAMAVINKKKRRTNGIFGIISSLDLTLAKQFPKANKLSAISILSLPGRNGSLSLLQIGVLQYCDQATIDKATLISQSVMLQSVWKVVGHK